MQRIFKISGKISWQTHPNGVWVMMDCSVMVFMDEF
jgi:hypothetical protein